MHKFTGDKNKHCANCYCWVCDIPASECKTWRHNHSSAYAGSSTWNAQRAANKAKAKKTQAQAQVAPVVVNQSTLTLKSKCR